MEVIIRSIQNELKKSSNAKTRESGKRFFREDVKLRGVKTQRVLSLAKNYCKQLHGKTKLEIFQICEELLKSEFMEDAFVAFYFSDSLHHQFERNDFHRFEKWVNTYISNWATCDTLCNHTIGTFVEMYPQYVKNLIQWTKSKNRWVKRASAVTLILPARRGKYLNEIFQISDALLIDRDDLVQKGYGWLLKEASKLHETEVFEYVQQHKIHMPRTALRYAIEKMNPEHRKKAME